MKPICPDDLRELARAKWDELVADAGADAITILDLDTIRDYAVAYAEEQAALKLLAELPNPFIVAGDGPPYVNPLRAVVNKARDQMARARRELRAHSASATTTKGDYKTRLLAEIQRRHLEVADDPDPGPCWPEALEHGPMFDPSRWFDCQLRGERRRWENAMAELEAESLVVMSRAPGAKWPSVKLTQTGETAIEANAKSE